MVVIAILAAILFPAFARARENARRASCQSNLKQIGLGILQYTQDYDERFPGADMGYDNSGTGPVRATWDTVTQPYLKSAQLIVCPSDTASLRVTHPLYGANATRSYSAVNQVFGFYPGASVPRALAEIPATALTVMVVERDQTGFINATWQSYVDTPDLGPSLAYRHLETTNMLYTDGHVKAQKGKAGGPYPNLTGYSVDATGSAQCAYSSPFPQ